MRSMGKKKAEVIFVTLPTPRNPKDGTCDLSIIDSNLPELIISSKYFLISSVYFSQSGVDFSTSIANIWLFLIAIISGITLPIGIHLNPCFSNSFVCLRISS